MRRVIAAIASDPTVLAGVKLECAEGWWALVTAADSAGRAAAPSWRMVNAREKMGRLTLYSAALHPEDREAAAAVVAAFEAAGGRICEVCGRRGRLRDAFGWVSVLCAWDHRVAPLLGSPKHELRWLLRRKRNQRRFRRKLYPRRVHLASASAGARQSIGNKDHGRFTVIADGERYVVKHYAETLRARRAGDPIWSEWRGMTDAAIGQRAALWSGTAADLDADFWAVGVVESIRLTRSACPDCGHRLRTPAQLCWRCELDRGHPYRNHYVGQSAWKFGWRSRLRIEIDYWAYAIRELLAGRRP
ncbi:hypothetical protein [Salinibacterium sp. ZJ450]|uniref:hypothetical protein n=1 Tax=Salinibacterium sp. ZJ450 TaxID=2708338 RepID=UPI0014205FFA|nr:hypothetical protein [Salinibacterium sp. ZJ450]